MKLCVQIIQSSDGNFVASCPSLPGCITRGESREEAIHQLDEAIRGYIAAVGDFVPERLEQCYADA